MGGIRIGTESAARGDDPDRRLLAHHGADLHRRGMGAEQFALAPLIRLHVKGVMHLPRRMLGRDIERGKIMEIVLDMRPFGDFEIHRRENFHHFFQNLCERVDAPFRLGLDRQCDIEFVFRQLGVEGPGLKLFPLGVQIGIDVAFQLVEGAAEGLFLFSA